MILIDTSAWIEFFRRKGDQEVKTRVANFIDLGEAAYCGPVQFELLSGARDAEVPTIRKALAFSVLLDFPIECWARAGELERSLRRGGVTVPRDDIFVVAAALHHNAPVYAVDAHFAMVRDAVASSLNVV